MTLSAPTRRALLIGGTAALAAGLLAGAGAVVQATALPDRAGAPVGVPAIVVTGTPTDATIPPSSTGAPTPTPTPEPAETQGGTTVVPDPQPVPADDHGGDRAGSGGSGKGGGGG